MIYFVRGQRSGMVKIGHTTALKKRLQALQVGAPERLEVLAVMEGGPEVERELHEHYAAERSTGEWFHPSARLMKFIHRKAQIKPPENHAADRWAERRRRVHNELMRQRLEGIQVAADRAGMSPRDWVMRVAMPDILRAAESPSDATNTLDLSACPARPARIARANPGPGNPA